MHQVSDMGKHSSNHRPHSMKGRPAFHGLQAMHRQSDVSTHRHIIVLAVRQDAQNARSQNTLSQWRMYSSDNTAEPVSARQASA